MRARLPSRSPTTVLICASASRIEVFDLRSKTYATEDGRDGADRGALPRSARVGQRRLHLRAARRAGREAGGGDAAAPAAARRADVVRGRQAARRRSCRRGGAPYRWIRPRRAGVALARGGRAGVPGIRGVRGPCVRHVLRVRAAARGRRWSADLRRTARRRARGGAVDAGGVEARAGLGGTRLSRRVCGGLRRAGRDGARALAGEVLRVPEVAEPCLVVGWPLGADGRKLYAGTALFTAEGELLGRARATWIVPRAASA